MLRQAYLAIETMVNVLKFQTLFFINFQIEILVIRTGIHKMLVGIACWEGPDQKQSDLGMAVWQATSVCKFRAFTKI